MALRERHQLIETPVGRQREEAWKTSRNFRHSMNGVLVEVGSLQLKAQLYGIAEPLLSCRTLMTDHE